MAGMKEKTKSSTEEKNGGVESGSWAVQEVAGKLLQLARKFWAPFGVVAGMKKMVREESFCERVVFLGLFGFKEREWKMKELGTGVVPSIFEHEDDVSWVIDDISDSRMNWVVTFLKFNWREVQNILSPPFTNGKIFIQNISTQFLSLDSFISQIHTPIFMNSFPTEFSYNLLKSTSFGKFFLDHLSWFSLLTVEGQANFYPP